MAELVKHLAQFWIGTASKSGSVFGRRQQTPLYDALCTAVYPTLTDKMAMKFGSKYKFSEVMARHWEQFALDAVLSPAQVKKRILDIAKRLPDLARATQVTFQSQGNSHPIIDQNNGLPKDR